MVAIPSTRVRPAMVSPVIDALCVGGLSIVVCVGLLIAGPTPLDKHLPPLVPYALTVAITWPHFLASYRLLYSTRESVMTYRNASLFFPAALGAFGIFAILRSPVSAVPVNLLQLVASVYLALHYTGQTWGMIASFSHLEGVPPSARERTVMLWSLRLIMTWHIVWATARGVGTVLPAFAPMATRIDARIDPLAIVSFALGASGLTMLGRRTGRFPPLRIILPWLALYCWYALLRKDPGSLFVVQLAHALQYIVFPLRIEKTRRDGASGRITAQSTALWLVPLMALSLGAFAGIPVLFRLSYESAGGTGDLAAAFLSVFVSFVNIHHYFIDGCLYKLRNPEVRRDLFAHVKPETPPAG